MPDSLKWYHIVYSFNDENDVANLYIDMMLVDSKEETTTIAYDTEPLLFGASNDFQTPQSFFKGDIDDIRIYNRVLSSCELEALYEMPYGSHTENTAKTCADGLDNDGDGLIDCDDPDCKNLTGNGCKECNDARNFADIVTEFNNGCPQFDKNESFAIGISDNLGVSIGRNGSIKIGFTDNFLSNSGDAREDIVVFEAGDEIETTYMAIKPADEATLNLLISYNVPDVNDNGFFEVGRIAGQPSIIDIDSRINNFSPTNEPLKAYSLNIAEIELIDSGSGNCARSYSGADIDAVCALYSVYDDLDNKIATSFNDSATKSNNSPNYFEDFELCVAPEATGCITVNLSNSGSNLEGCENVNYSISNNSTNYEVLPVMPVFGIFVICPTNDEIVDEAFDMQLECGGNTFTASLYITNNCDTSDGGPSGSPSGSFYICDGDEIDLTVSGGLDSYVWTNSKGKQIGSGTSITVTNGGIYRLEVGKTFRGVTFTHNLSFKVYEGYNSGKIFNETVSLCEGESLRLDSYIRNAVNWNWSPADRITIEGFNNSVVYNPVDGDVFAAEATDIYGCNYTQIVNISVLPACGCTDPEACNYDSSAKTNIGCEYGLTDCVPDNCDIVIGCTDPKALNYNPDACFNFLSCMYANPCTEIDCNSSSCIDISGIDDCVNISPNFTINLDHSSYSFSPNGIDFFDFDFGVPTNSSPNCYLKVDGDNKVCIGGNNLLTANEGFDTYLWYKNGRLVERDRTINANEAGMYLLIVEKEGCFNMVVIYIEEMEFTFSVMEDNLSVCSGGCVALTGRATEVVSYEWTTKSSANIFGANTPNAIACNVRNGDEFTFSVENTSGCRASTTVNVNVLDDCVYPSTP